MSVVEPDFFKQLYARFDAPITRLNCGDQCAPHNERGVPFCCDTHHAVPTAYTPEWDYLQANTDLWHRWQAEDPRQTRNLEEQTPTGQVLIECKGHLLCQRGFRSLTCRAFPFFPYITPQGEFNWLSYYLEYYDRCWVISNLQVISLEYRMEFIAAYNHLFAHMPEEKENFHYHSSRMRRLFGRRKRAIPLLHRNGGFYKVTPRNGRMRRVKPEYLPKFGPYSVVAELPFPDEVNRT
ncbi:MAG: hypothetical protein P8Z00_03735 [Anaerolineales bacterium]